MNKVVRINSRRLFGRFFPQAPERVSEGLRFFAGAVLTLLFPTFIYCYETSQYMPLVLVIGQVALGVLAGVLLHKKFGKHVRSGISIYQAPRIPGDKKNKGTARKAS